MTARVRAWPALILGVLLVACTPDPGALEAPGAIVATREYAVRSAGGPSVSAPGDSLDYTLSWTAGRGATGYLVTTTTPNPGWSGMLTNAPTTALTMAFRPINATAWDSVAFTACVLSTGSSGKKSGQACTTWKLVRAPGLPGNPAVDSSRITVALLEFPHGATTLVDVPVRICPYFVALDGKARLVDGYNGAYCRGMYDDSIPAAMHLPGYPIQYDVATSVRAWGPLRLAVRTPQDQLAHEMFARPT